MLLLNRRDSVKGGLSPGLENLGWKGWKMGMMRRKMMDMLGGGWKNTFLKMFFKKSWGKHRNLPEVAKESFSKQWVNRVESREWKGESGKVKTEN